VAKRERCSSRTVAATPPRLSMRGPTKATLARGASVRTFDGSRAADSPDRSLPLSTGTERAYRAWGAPRSRVGQRKDVRVPEANRRLREHRGYNAHRWEVNAWGDVAILERFSSENEPSATGNPRGGNGENT